MKKTEYKHVYLCDNNGKPDCSYMYQFTYKGIRYAKRGQDKRVLALMVDKKLIDLGLEPVNILKKI